MTRRNIRTEDIANRRQRAEEIARSKFVQSPEIQNPLSMDEMRILHELQVHQIELEIQNDELRQKQLELEASQARYFDLYNLAPVGYCTLSENGRIIEVNLVAATQLGVDVAMLVRQLITHFILPEDREIYSQYQLRLTTGKPQACELRMLRKEGPPFWARLETTVTQNTENALLYRVAISDINARKQAEESLKRTYDELEQRVAERTLELRQANEVLRAEIAERKLIEKALKSSEQRFMDIADHAQEWIWEVDLEGKYTYASPIVEKILGYSQDEILRKRFYDLFHPDDQKLLKAAIMAAFASQLPYKGLINRIAHKNGETVWLTSSGLPMFDDKGNLLGYRGVDTDITEHKLAEAEKAKLEVRFQKTQKLESIGQLAGGVAHDFNNILAATMIRINILNQNPSLNLEAHESLEELLVYAKRAASLTRQLLIFSRRSVLETRVLDLNEVAGNLLKMLGRLIGEHITLRFDRKDDLPPVEADLGMMEQVLMNLVLNARDSMPHGGNLNISTQPVQLNAEQVKCNTEARPGLFVCVSVADTGSGMDESTRKRIFEPFFTTKEPGKGTGLGLATVYGIIAQHKGLIEVETILGKGSTFKVFLPATTRSKPEPVPIEKRPAIRGRETILLVEDEANVRRALAESLRLLGYRMLVANNGQEAIHMWKEHSGKIDLLFSDMMMSEGLTGLDLAGKLMEADPLLKVIISSGYSAEITGRGNPAAVNITYLQKPYEAELMLKTVRECLDRK